MSISTQDAQKVVAFRGVEDFQLDPSNEARDCPLISLVDSTLSLIIEYFSNSPLAYRQPELCAILSEHEYQV